MVTASPERIESKMGMGMSFYMVFFFFIYSPKIFFFSFVQQVMSLETCFEALFTLVLIRSM